MNCGARRLCHQSCISPEITLETSADGAPATGCFHRHGVPRASLTSALQHTLGGASPCFLFEGGSIAHQKKTKRCRGTVPPTNAPHLVDK
jgi:hypothetical protein